MNYEVKILKLSVALTLMVTEFGHQSADSNELHAVRTAEKVLKETY